MKFDTKKKKVFQNLLRFEREHTDWCTHFMLNKVWLKKYWIFTYYIFPQTSKMIIFHSV